MLTSWLTFTAFLAASVNPERAAITVTPTCRVKGHPEAELTLNCGDGKITGVVQYWHTPFGDLQHPASHSELDPVFMHSDGSLVVPNTSILHSGLYYCLLQHTEGTTLWPYELHVGRNNQKNQEDGEYEQHRSSCGAFRFRRDIGSEAERQEGVSDELFAGAVAASVLLTFVVGFSAGALSRPRVLRCLRAVTTRLPSPRKRRCQTASRESEVNMTDLPPMRENQAFEADTSAHSTTSSPPTKPQRSFRHKLQQQQETTAYLEGCDHMKEERRREEVKEVAGGSLEEQNKVFDGVTEEEEVEVEVEEEEEEEERVFYLSGEDGGSQTETDEGECSEETEEKDRRECKEEEKEVEEERSEEGGDRRGSVEEVGGNKEKGSDEKEGWREEKEVEEERNEQEGEDRRESVEEAGGNKEEGRDEKEEEEEEEEEGGDGETDSGSDDDETGSQKQEDTIKSGTTEEEEQPESSTPRLARRSRIIRLYQYDDDGQRYSHLPEPAPVQPRPAPRLRQRSVSLTRLSAIMAAASAGPLDTREGGKEERTHFHMEI